MSIVLGKIKGDKIYLSADTKVARIDDPKYFKEGYNKLYTFELDNNKYIFATVGDVSECESFLNILDTYQFDIPFDYHQVDFMKKIQTILQSYNLKTVFVLFGCIENGIPFLYSINDSLFECTRSEGLVVLPPYGTKQYIKQYLDEFSSANKELENTDILCYINKFQQFVGDKSSYKYINDDFNYKVLFANGDIEESKISKKGYKVC